MPAPVIYVAAVIGGAAAVIAFKEFVYDPHLAPKIEAYLAARRRRMGQGPVPVPSLSDTEEPDTGSRRLYSNGKDDGDDHHASFELEKLVSPESWEWRSGIDSGDRSELRQRNVTHTLDEEDVPIAFPAIAPTHVISNTSEPSTPTSPTTTRLSFSPSSQTQTLSPRPSDFSVHSLPRSPAIVLSPRPFTPDTLSTATESPTLSPFIVASPPPVTEDIDNNLIDTLRLSFSPPSGSDSGSESGSSSDSPAAPASMVGSPLTSFLGLRAANVTSPVSDLDLLSVSEDDFEDAFSDHDLLSPEGRDSDDEFSEPSHDESEASSWASVRSR